VDVLIQFDHSGWDEETGAEAQSRAAAALEQGHVLYFPKLKFVLAAAERGLLTPAVADGKSKNISYHRRLGRLTGTGCQGQERTDLESMLTRFSAAALSFVSNLLPGYRDHLEPGLATFRPFQVQGRATSVKKDDARLHVDAFASRPNQGRRLLRVFSNVNPGGEPRVWQVGEPFEALAKRFLPQAAPQLPGSAWLLYRLGVTKSLRSPYDHLMLQLHDRGKKDRDYQATAPRTTIEFPPGTTWVMFSDQVLHAALSGQYLLEQTFYLPVSGMRDLSRSPLRVLERLTGRRLV
jgi:3-deoxy-D-manno-octulosonic acid hydroxylase-like protein